MKMNYECIFKISPLSLYTGNIWKNIDFEPQHSETSTYYMSTECILLSFCVFTIFIGAPSLESVISRMLLLYLHLCCIRFVFLSLSFFSTQSRSIISKGIFLSWEHCFTFHHFTFSLCFVSERFLCRFCDCLQKEKEKKTTKKTYALCQSPFFSSLVYMLEFRSILSLLSIQLLHLSSWCCFMLK